MLGWLQCQLPNTFDYLYQTICSTLLVFFFFVFFNESAFISFPVCGISCMFGLTCCNSSRNFPVTKNFFHCSPNYLYTIVTLYCNTEKINTSEDTGMPFSSFILLYAAFKVCDAFSYKEHVTLKWKTMQKRADD